MAGGLPSGMVHDFSNVPKIRNGMVAITHNGSRLGEVVDFGKLSLKFITNVK